MPDPQESEPAAPDPRPAWARGGPARDRAGRFQLGPLLGQGGMGRVHAAWDPVLNREVAVKLLHGNEPVQHMRFLVEAQAQARLEHPCICPILEIGTAADRPFIAMRLVRGGSIADLRPELSFQDIAGLLAEVAGAVAAAHAAGLVHRDIKPSNILVETTGAGLRHPYLMDFGAVRDLGGLDLTLTWTTMGTPAFMSPEQARGDRVGPAADIYSFGATLYALLSGAPPFEAATVAGLTRQQELKDPPPLHRRVPGVPRDLARIALKCLEWDPARRYPDALALGADLARFQQGRPVLARRVGPLGRLWRWAQRRRPLAATLAVSALLLAAVSARSTQMAREGRRREQAAQAFALEIRNAEHLLRIERMLPPHDIRPAEARLRASLDGISRDMARLGAPARGPGLYALGRGHLSLREYEAARGELQAAWDAGFQPPEVAYALGLVHFQIYLKRVPDYHWTEGWQGFRHVQKADEGWLQGARYWFHRAGGASVDAAGFGEAMALFTEFRLVEANRVLDQVLLDHPWAYEALQLKASIAGLSQDEGPLASPSIDTHPGRLEEAAALLERARILAPSDDDLAVSLARLRATQWIYWNAHGNRDPAPLEAQRRTLAAAVSIRPDGYQLRDELINADLQAGLLDLATGRDPGARVRAAAGSVDTCLADPALPAALRIHLQDSLKHNLWWVAAEADLRFGRDPRPALLACARVRAAAAAPELHHPLSLLCQARAEMRAGQDPSASFREAGAVLAALAGQDPQKRSWWFRSVRAELAFLEARWHRSRGQDPGPWVRQGLAFLAEAVALDARGSNIYYILPRLHALACRACLGTGRLPEASAAAAAAVAAARQGLALAAGNASVQLAAADAFLAQAEAAAAAGGAAGPWREEARAALDRCARTDPRALDLPGLRAVLARPMQSGRGPAEVTRP